MKLITDRILEELKARKMSAAELGRRMEPPMKKNLVHNYLKQGQKLSFEQVERMLKPLGLTLSVKIEVVKKRSTKSN